MVVHRTLWLYLGCFSNSFAYLFFLFFGGFGGCGVITLSADLMFRALLFRIHFNSLNITVLSLQAAW